MLREYILCILLFMIIFIRQSVASDYELGDTPHEWQVEHGEAVISVPIPFPKGVNQQLTPDLKLEYRSNNPMNRELGFGWRLSGMSEITRCTKNYALDGRFEALRFDFGDPLCLDGQRLIFARKPNNNQTEYRTEIESYKRVVAHDSLGYGPKYFKVYTKENLIYTYGLTDESTIRFYRVSTKSESSTASRWLLSRIEDYSGNFIRFNYDKEIQYSYAYLTSIVYANRVINFAYESSRTDVQRHFYKNLLEFEIRKRLVSISIAVKRSDSGANLMRERYIELKRLKIGYNVTNTAKISILTSVQLCHGGDKCLRPLMFQYDQTEIKKFDSSSFTVHNLCGNLGDQDCEIGLAQPADMNGDGLLDLVAFGKDGVYVSLNRGRSGSRNSISFEYPKKWTSEFSKDFGWNIKKHLRYIVDVNADGLPDILGIGETSVSVSLNMNGYFQELPAWSSDFVSNKGYRVGEHARWPVDIDNDGRPDLAVMRGRPIGGFWYALNINSTKLSDAEATVIGEFSASDKWGIADYPVTFVDLDNDGVKERVGFGSLGLRTARLTSSGQYASIKYTSGTNCNYNRKDKHLIVDVNNDGLADLIGFRNSDSKVYTAFMTPEGTGIDQLKCSSVLSGPYIMSGSIRDRVQQAADFNGDGLADLISFDGPRVLVGLNDGTGNMLEKSVWTYGFLSALSAAALRETTSFVVDMDGDQMLDVIGFEKNSQGRKLAKILFNKNRRLRMISLVDSFGNLKSIQYSTLANEAATSKYTSHTPIADMKSTSSGYTKYGLNPEVVVSFTTSNGIGSTSKLSFSYGPYQYGTTQGRYDCSFAWIRSESNDTGIVALDEFYQTYPLTGLTRSKKSFRNGSLLSWKSFKFVATTRKPSANVLTGQVTREVILKSKKNDQFEPNGRFLKTEITEYEYDEYGNTIRMVENVTDANKILTVSRVTTNEYRNTLDTWYLGEKLSQSVVNIQESKLKGLMKSPLREEFYEWNSKNRLISKLRTQPNTANVGIEETFEYNQFGNVVVNKQRALATNEIRTRNMVFDSYGLNLISVTNSLGQKETYSYDSADNLLRHVDSNAQETVFTYDALNRKIKMVNGEKKTTWSYEWDLSLARSVYRITSMIDDSIKQTIYYDSLNREIRKVKHGLIGEKIYEDSEFDEVGNLVRKSLPYKAVSDEKPLYITFEYDIMMREIRRVENFPNGNILINEYDGYKLKKSEPGGSFTINTLNVLDQVVKVEDALGSIATYEYDLFGNLIKITDPSGGVTTMSYNLNGEKLSKNDTSGYIVYEYNAFNELVSSKNSNGTEIRFERDLLGRMTKRIEPEGVTVWTYDTAKNGIGNIARVFSSANNYSVEIKYNSRGLPIEKKISYGGQDEYTLRTTYDNLGRIVSESYPNGDIIYQCFNKFGYLWAVSTSDSSCNRADWRALDYDSIGSITREIYANGLVNEYTYAESTQMQRVLTRLEALPTSSPLRRIEYEYDTRQNLVQRSTLLETAKIVNKFSYDILNRLTRANTYDIKSQIQESKLVESLSWSYDGMGNMLSYEDSTGKRAYDYDATKRQQAVKIGNETLKYDKLGNVMSTCAYSIDWYSFSKPRVVIPSKSSYGPPIRFFYGPSRELVAKTIGGADKTADSTTIHFVDDLYEKWTIKNGSSLIVVEKFHIRVLGRVISTRILARNTSTSNISSTTKLYFHHDAFGSVDTVSNSSGLIVLRYDYSPFGQSKLVMSNLASDVIALLNLGYGGHASIEGTRIVYMKGRIYDPLFARFLSPDPFIQDIYNIQNLNRYSYGLNNPFRFNDPSGKFFKALKKFFSSPVFKIIAAVAISVATANLASAYIAPALINSLGVTSAFATSVITGAVVGAATGFTSTLYLTGGNMDAAIKGAGIGAITGGISGGISNLVTNEYSNFVANKLADGLVNRARKRDFFDGLQTSVVSFVAAKYYESVVGYEATSESGGEAVPKSYWSRPVKDRNNIGPQGNAKKPYELVLGEPTDFLAEGGVLSRFLNKIGGINAVAGMHDSIQINFSGILREILNVPNMPIAAVFTYTALYNDIKCPYC